MCLETRNHILIWSSAHIKAILMKIIFNSEKSGPVKTGLVGLVATALQNTGYYVYCVIQWWFYGDLYLCSRNASVRFIVRPGKLDFLFLIHQILCLYAGGRSLFIIHYTVIYSLYSNLFKMF